MKSSHHYLSYLQYGVDYDVISCNRCDAALFFSNGKKSKRDFVNFLRFVDIVLRSSRRKKDYGVFSKNI